MPAMPSSSPTPLAVIGPTGSGKSALGITLAERFGGEIVNCDAIAVADTVAIVAFAMLLLLVLAKVYQKMIKKLKRKLIFCAIVLLSLLTKPTFIDQPVINVYWILSIQIFKCT